MESSTVKIVIILLIWCLTLMLVISCTIVASEESSSDDKGSNNDSNNDNEQKDATLTFSSFFQDGQGTPTVDGLDGHYGIVVSGDGKNVYVAGAFDNAIAIFNRDTNTGALTYSTMLVDGTGTVDGLDLAYDIVVSHNYKNVYVTGNGEHALSTFSRDTSMSNNPLSYSSSFKDGTGVDGLNNVRGVAISPDGENVYAAGTGDKALSVFNRNTATGVLSYQTVFKDGLGTPPVDGLDGSRHIAVSYDGKNVYVTGYADDALTVFNRDTASINNPLTYSMAFQDDGTASASYDGLDGATNIAISHDDRNVYVAGYTDNALVVFDRNPTTGILTYSGVFKDNIDSVDGLAGAHGVAVSHNDKYVYVAGYNDNALAVFTRNTATGELTYSKAFQNNIDGVAGLGAPTDIAVSPDDKNIYVTGFNNDTLAVFTWH